MRTRREWLEGMVTGNGGRNGRVKKQIAPGMTHTQNKTSIPQ